MKKILFYKEKVLVLSIQQEGQNMRYNRDPDTESNQNIPSQIEKPSKEPLFPPPPPAQNQQQYDQPSSLSEFKQSKNEVSFQKNLNSSPKIQTLSQKNIDQMIKHRSQELQIARKLIQDEKDNLQKYRTFELLMTRGGSNLNELIFNQLQLIKTENIQHQKKQKRSNKKVTEQIQKEILSCFQSEKNMKTIHKQIGENVSYQSIRKIIKRKNKGITKGKKLYQ